MASGWTTTVELSDSLQTIVDAARIVAEYEAVMPKLVERRTLAKGQGSTWNEISLAQLTASSVTETTVLENPQQILDTLFSITLSRIGIHLIITDQVRDTVAPVVLAKHGVLARNAMDRKLDRDGITILDGATNGFGGTGQTISASWIIDATVRAKHGAGNEPSSGPVYAVIHPYHIADLSSELTAGLGTYPIPAGITEEAYRRGFEGTLGGAMVYAGKNIVPDSVPDAKGGVFAKEAIILVQQKGLTTEGRRMPEYGGGADALWMYHRYAYGERSSGNWLYEIYGDATAPTS